VLVLVCFVFKRGFPRVLVLSASMLSVAAYFLPPAPPPLPQHRSAGLVFGGSRRQRLATVLASVVQGLPAARDAVWAGLELDEVAREVDGV
jgi:hypothetical protein